MNIKAYTFFGHRECSDLQKEILQSTLEYLISQNMTHFYVGNQGQFDMLVLQTLRELESRYPQIDYAVVLAYPLSKRNRHIYEKWETLLPANIEAVFPRFAISYRNKWMLQQCEIVVTYITHDYGGAAKFAELARKQDKVVINLAEKSWRASDRSEKI